MTTSSGEKQKQKHSWAEKCCFLSFYFFFLFLFFFFLAQALKCTAGSNSLICLCGFWLPAGIFGTSLIYCYTPIGYWLISQYSTTHKLFLLLSPTCLLITFFTATCFLFFWQSLKVKTWPDMWVSRSGRCFWSEPVKQEREVTFKEKMSAAESHAEHKLILIHSINRDTKMILVQNKRAS